MFYKFNCVKNILCLLVKYIVICLIINKIPDVLYFLNINIFTVII